MSKTIEQELQQNANLPELDRLYHEHPTLHELTLNDADVYAWFRMCALGRCTVEETLIGALVHVQAAKERLFKQLMDEKLRQHDR